MAQIEATELFLSSFRRRPLATEKYESMNMADLANFFQTQKKFFTVLRETIYCGP